MQGKSKGNKVRIGAKKNNKGEYEVSFVMDRATMESRLKMIDEKIRALERSVELYTEQLELLKREKAEIENVLSLNKG